jgi:chromosome segregation ATPase
MDSLTARIDETNKRIDAVREELTAKIDETNKRIDTATHELTARIDETNKRIDVLSTRLEENTRELGELKAEIVALRSRQEIIEDLVRRVRKLEDKVFA